MKGCGKMEMLKWIFASVVVSMICYFIRRAISNAEQNKSNTQQPRSTTRNGINNDPYKNIKIGDPLPNADKIIKESLESGKNGDPMGMLNIGVSYKNGVNGYPKDREKAKRIFQTVIDIAPNSQAASIAKLELSDI